MVFVVAWSFIVIGEIKFDTIIFLRCFARRIEKGGEAIW